MAALQILLPTPQNSARFSGVKLSHHLSDFIFLKLGWFLALIGLKVSFDDFLGHHVIRGSELSKLIIFCLHKLLFKNMMKMG